jgi:hypothetical protein
MNAQKREELLALLDDVKAKNVEINAELEKVAEGVVQLQNIANKVAASVR